MAVPKTAETVVAATGGSIVGGGVDLRVNPFVAPGARQVDAGGEALTPARERASRLRASAGAGAVMNPPASPSDPQPPSTGAR
jgi:hypothetical protein